MLKEQHNTPLKKSLKYGAQVILMVIPVTIVMTVFLPRLPAFWQLPTTNIAKTGLSENVDPFELSELSKSSELAFRAEFKTGEPFIGEPLYWRAIVHDTFDGKRWAKSGLQNTPFQNRGDLSNQNITYSEVNIIAEPSHLPWLFGMGVSKSRSPNFKINYFGIPYVTKPRSNAFEYKIESTIGYLGNNLTNWEKKNYLNIPDDLNPKSLTLVKELNNNSKSTEDYLKNIKTFFQSSSFSYTLSPPSTQSRDTIDFFLFESRTGFCGHYASTLAFMLRANQIPARLVSGYLGGEKIQQGNYYNVYQYDAHAWVEYYDSKKGWQRIDPTAWVAPQRLRGSLSMFTEVSEEFQEQLGLALMGMQQYYWAKWLRDHLETLDYTWTKWVVNFDSQKQSYLLEKLLGKKHYIYSGIVAIISIIAAFSLFFIILSYSRREKHPVIIDVYYKLLKLSNQFEGATPNQVIQSMIEKYPIAKSELELFYHLFELSQYKQVSLTAKQDKQIKQLLKSITKKVKRQK